LLTRDVSVCLRYLEYFKAQDHSGIDYQNENTPFIDSRHEVVSSYGPVTSGENFNSVTIADEVDQFVGGDDADEFSSDADGLIQFCTLSTVKPARSDLAAVPSYVALLDDKCCAFTQAGSRPCPGPLTAADLFRHLKRPRFPHRRRAHSSDVKTSTLSDPRPLSPNPRIQFDRASDEDKCPTASSPSQLSVSSSRSDLEAETKEPDADRRIVFITDLEFSTTLALIRTVSGNHVRALRDLLCNHLAGQSVIASNITQGLIMFKLSFHLSFVALRYSHTPRADRRLSNGDTPLRSTKDITFLNWHTPDSRTLVQLHEAQVSCVVSGFHDQCWIAHCIVDTYYDGNDESRESVKNYDDQATLLQGMALDAPTMGKLDRDQPIWNPREYFIHVVYYRLLKAKLEWKMVYKVLRDSFRRYTQMYDRPSNPRRTPDHARNQEYHKYTPQQSLDLLMQYLSLFSKLDESLTKTIDSYEAFRTKSMDFFEDVQQTALGGTSLDGINSIFEVLNSLKKEIGYMDHEGQRMKAALELVLTREDFRTNKEQSQLVGYMMPIATTTSFFSMQKNIPFAQGNFAWFVAFIGVFSLLAFGSHIFRVGVQTRSRIGKTIGDCGYFWKDLNLRARRRKNRRIDDLENGSQLSSNNVDEGTLQHGTSSSQEPQSAFSSGMSTPPSTFIANHNQPKEIAPRGSHLIRNQETLT
jgi:hypothetical protein